MVEGGAPSAAVPLFEHAIDVADADPDVLALARLGMGQARLLLGDTTDGMTLFDEVMVSVTADEVSPIVAGLAYCAVIDACSQSFDVRRAGEWTAALTRWCEGQPDLVPYRGQCLVHRATLLRLRGEWPDALEEVERARARLSEPPGQPAVGEALYELGEQLRVRGDLTGAEHAFHQARDAGRSPQPGLALVRLAQGRMQAAEAAIRREVDAAAGPVARCRLLGAFVEIQLACGDTNAARAAADELAAVATDRGVPFLEAVAAYASGAVRQRDGDALAALRDLERARDLWRRLDLPYDGARTRASMGQALLALGDKDAADVEMDAARKCFRELGAEHDLEALDATSAPAALPDGLTSREAEVIALVATGRTNRAIAAELVISEKTVARHVSNIFAKLGISSRAAATAYVYEHHLV
jgi:DNA-binding CsgD family transcriptional regulator